MRKALSALTDKQYTIVMAHYIDGLSFREIARRMGVGKTTVLYHFNEAEKIIKSFFWIFLSKTHFSCLISEGIKISHLHWQLKTPQQIRCRYCPVKQTSDTPKTWLLFKGAVFVGYILGSLQRRAKTNNGDNDTSVAKARPAEYPAGVRFPWWQLVTVSLLHALFSGCWEQIEKQKNKTTAVKAATSSQLYISKQGVKRNGS